MIKEYSEPEAEIVIEGELLKADEALTPNQIKMNSLRDMRTTALKTTKKQQRINVSKTMAEFGYDPVITQILIATNQWEALGLSKPCSVHEINSSSQCLLSYTAPTLKPVEHIDEDKRVMSIPTFVPARGIIRERVDLLEAPSFLDNEDDEDEE